MFFALSFVLWAWGTSLESAAGFEQVSSLMTGFIAKFIAWGTLAALAYHLLAGVRHLLMDMGYFEELESGNSSAVATLALWVVIAIALGVWLWS